MEALRAADDEQRNALHDVERHISRYKRAIEKYQRVEQKEETERELVPFTSTIAQEELAQTRATGGRPRLATISVECEQCQGHEVYLRGGEAEFLKKKKPEDKLYCQHGKLVVRIAACPSTHVQIRPVKQLFQKRNKVPISQVSSKTSEVTPAKLRQLSEELDRLDTTANEKHETLCSLLRDTNFVGEPDALELLAEKERVWGEAQLTHWRNKLFDMVDTMREKAEEVQLVADETHSTLNSPT